jgi:hypothetical protein
MRGATVGGGMDCTMLPEAFTQLRRGNPSAPSSLIPSCRAFDLTDIFLTTLLCPLLPSYHTLPLSLYFLSVVGPLSQTFKEPRSDSTLR